MILVVAPSIEPFEVAVYDAKGKRQSHSKGKDKISESLIHVIEPMFERYDIDRLVYINGPGSHMATKITYVILRTISIMREIPLYGCSAFAINGGKPVKAVGQLYFVKEKETIITKKLPEKITTSYNLPEFFGDMDAVLEKAEPDYRLPAV